MISKTVKGLNDESLLTSRHLGSLPVSQSVSQLDIVSQSAVSQPNNQPVSYIVKKPLWLVQYLPLDKSKAL